jgi:hypothetical protein
VNSLKGKVAVSTDGMYVISGASGRLGKDKGSRRRQITAASEERPCPGLI